MVHGVVVGAGAAAAVGVRSFVRSSLELLFY